MRKYSYTNDKMTSRANGNVAWSGTILDPEGIPVCDVWNEGDGGCNYYHWHHTHLKLDFELKAQAEFPDDLEPVDAYVAKLWEETLGDTF